MTPPNAPRQEDGDPRPDIASKTYTTEIASEDGTSPATCVVEAVAEATGTAVEELQPLYDAIDPDALNQLIGSPHRFTGGRIQFGYAGCAVTVDAAGRIAVSSRLADEE